MKYQSLKEMFKSGITKHQANEVFMRHLSAVACQGVLSTALEASIREPGKSREYYIACGVSEFLNVGFVGGE